MRSEVSERRRFGGYGRDIPIPRAVARFNKGWTNRFFEPLARRSSGFVVVHHRGRRSGLAYTTPVNAFPLDESLIVSLTYGPSAD